MTKCHIFFTLFTPHQMLPLLTVRYPDPSMCQTCRFQADSASVAAQEVPHTPQGHPEVQPQTDLQSQGVIIKVFLTFGLHINVNLKDQKGQKDNGIQSTGVEL